jgi:PAS domain S-box-containing protein/putative nucleotidyltransferase with HDIG domain
VKAPRPDWSEREREHVEDELRQSEQRYRALFDGAIEGIFQTLPDGRILTANPSLARMLGYASPAELLAELPNAAQAWADPAERQRVSALLVETGALRGYECRFVRKDGQEIWVSLNSNLARGPDGEPCFEGFIEDITVRKRAEAASRESDLRFRAFVEQAPVAIGVVRQGTVLYANQRCAEMLGVQGAEELVGTDVSLVFAPQARGQSQELIRRRSLGLPPLTTGFESVFVRADGSEFPVHCATGRVLLADGEADITFVTDITDRRRAEDALRASVAMRDLAEPVARIGTWRRPVGAGTSSWTDGMLALFDAGPGELEGDAEAVLAKSVHPDDLGRLREALAALVQTGQALNTDFRVVRRDGTERVLRAEGRAEREDTGEEVVIGYCQDVTDQREAAGRLEAAAQEWRETFDAMEDPVLLVGRDGRVARCNAAAAALTGLGFGDIVGRHCYELFHGPGYAGDCAACPQRLAFETGEVCTTVLERDGRWLRASCKPQLGADGRVSGAVHVVTDITLLRQAERAASERSHFLEELLEAVPVPLFYKDTSLRYGGMNQAFAAWVGSPEDQVIGKTVFDVRSGREAESIDAADRDLLARRDRSAKEEQVLTGPDGKPRNVLNYRAVFSDIEGKPAGIVGVNLDVTEIRQAEEKLAAGALRLRQTLHGAVAALSATTELRDPYTAGHQRRVAELACAIALQLGFSDERTELLRTAALLHDVGKILVPAEILSKPGRLTDLEMQIIRQHPGAGADIIGPIGFDPDVAEIVRQHHERLDGSGYPAGLRGEGILAEARVLAVADVAEAMISHRPYRPGLPLEAAVEELNGGAGVRYESSACAAAISLLCHQGFAFSQ